MQRLSFLLAVLIFTVQAYAQISLSGAIVESDVEYTNLDEIFSDYEIYRIDVNRNPIDDLPSSFLMDLNLGDRHFSLNLYKGNLTTSFEAANKPQLLGGSLSNGGLVSLTINDDFLFGFIQYGDNKYYIEPLRHIERESATNLYLFYNVSNVIETGEHLCGVEHVEAKTPKIPNELLKMPTTMCKVVDYAIANTFDMVGAFGTSTQVMNFNLGVLNDVQTNYRSEFDSNLEYDVVAHYVPTSSSGNPFSPPSSSNDGGVLLSRFDNWANGGGNSSGGASGGFGVNYNMACVWRDTDFCAIIGSTCNFGVVGIAQTPGWHHILENYTSAAASLQSMVSHEVGHNWSYGHDAGGSNFIMAPSVTLTGNWSTPSKNAINNRIASQSYLSACSTIGPPNANFFQSDLATCVNGSVEFEDQSQYGATRNWTFMNGTPATSTNEKPTVTFNIAGLQGVVITSTNGAGSDDFASYIDVQNTPPTICTPSGSGGSAGIDNFVLENVSNSSTTSGAYEDFTCTEIIMLEESTSYNFFMSVAGVSRLRYFFDYNDDGDFSDAGEASSQFTLPNPNGNYNIPFTTPSSVTTGQLLRMRVTVSTSSIASSGCTSPTTGQVEDYSIYFEEPQIFGCTDPSASNYDPTATVDDGSCMFGSTTWYQDSDGDLFGNPNVSQTSTTQPPGYVLDNTDCDDNNPFAFPGNPEVCDGADNNCDGNIDEGVQNTYFRDFDGDGFGDPAVTTMACSQPSGFVLNNSDCDDNDPLEFPGQIWFRDFDGDGYSNGAVIVSCIRPNNHYDSTELTATSGDCDDEEPNAFPGNPEVCDGIDNNCNNNVDEGVTTRYYKDLDGDGFGDPNQFSDMCTQLPDYVLDDTDCDDNDPNAYPGNTEVCDGVDNNCDGSIDEGFSSTFYEDSDGDGFGNPSVSIQDCSQPAGFVDDNTDCDDNDALEYPGQTWYKDVDGDGYSDATTQVNCTRPADYYAASELFDTFGDCDDTESSAFPGASEICSDDIDNDCNGLVDDGCGSPPDCDGTNLDINNIVQDAYYAEMDITSDATADNGQEVLFVAGSEILLEGNFEVEAGTEFLAIISPCASNIENPDEGPETDRIVLLKDTMEEIQNDFDLQNDSTPAQYKLFNRWGEIMKSGTIQASNMRSEIDEFYDAIPAGMYILTVEKANSNKKYYIYK